MKTKLTLRELQVLRQIVQDHRDSEIETENQLGIRTANSILNKLNREPVTDNALAENILVHALREINAGIYNDNGDVTWIGPLGVAHIARKALATWELEKVST